MWKFLAEVVAAIEKVRLILGRSPICPAPGVAAAARLRRWLRSLAHASNVHGLSEKGLQGRDPPAAPAQAGRGRFEFDALAVVGGDAVIGRERRRGIARLLGRKAPGPGLGRGRMPVRCSTARGRAANKDVIVGPPRALPMRGSLHQCSAGGTKRHERKRPQLNHAKGRHTNIDGTSCSRREPLVHVQSASAGSGVIGPRGDLPVRSCA
jgi:hypothetical protein